MEFRLITYRDVFQWAARRQDPAAYQEHSAQVRLSPEDMKSLGVRSGDTVSLSNTGGEVVVLARADAHCPAGHGLMPLSAYANRLSGYDPQVSPLPNFKNIPVTIQPTDSGVTPLVEVERGVLERG
ncbi:MAG: molybdopterin dinucleotide binding domain-containing protein [Dehalococcoidia bacterium]|jgi:formylmethanofuran dehydrogenase subunit D|nr:molybdopterin dinucleotide binding domain-containing protein [Dehalococcoidia bacterium]